MAAPLALYLHFPFCLSKCAYCDFNSIVADGGLRAAYLTALTRQVAEGPLGPGAGGNAALSRPVTSIYLGGGTPTVYRAEELLGVLAAVRARFSVASDAEMTCEANPGTITSGALAELRGGGVTRLSIGVQSFVDTELSLLGRIHSAAQAREAVEAAKDTGFRSVSLDLIRALPGQRRADWDRTLEAAIGYRPDHLSCYGLSIEEGTELAGRVACGALRPASPERAAELFLQTHQRLVANGYTHYEISNFALPGHECRHNLTYWRNEEYLGFGAGAWSYLGGERWRWTSGAGRYVAEVEEGS